MKKMTTVLAMLALTLTLSTLAFGQNGKRTQRGMQGGATKGRQATGTGNNVGDSVVYVGGSGRKTAKPNNVTINGSMGNDTFGLAGRQRPSEVGKSNHDRGDIIQGGAGNDNVQRRSKIGKPNRFSSDFDNDSDVDSSDFRRRNKAAQPSQQAAGDGKTAQNSALFADGSVRQRNNASPRSSVGSGSSKSIESFNFGSSGLTKARRQSKTASSKHLVPWTGEPILMPLKQ